MKKLIVILLCQSILSANSYACESINVGGQVVYTKSEVIPFWNKDSVSYSNFDILNVSNSYIQIKLDLFLYNGTVYENANTPLNRIFSASNNPVNGWASIGPRELGVVQIPLGGINDYGHAVVTWQHTECIQSPLRVTTWHGFNYNSSITTLSDIKL